MRAILCTVATQGEAARIVDDLVQAGVDPDDISVLFRDARTTRHFARAQHTNTPRSHAGDMAAGGIAVGTLGVLGAVLLVGVPGLGPFLAAGPIVAAVAGFGASLAGSIEGALLGFGVDEDEARVYRRKLSHGHVVVGMHSDYALFRVRAADIFARAGAEDISRVELSHTAATTPA